MTLSTSAFATTVVRFATIFGLSPKMRFNLFINDLARETGRNGKFSIKNKKAWRPFLHVQDASDAVIKILNSEKSIG